MSLLRWPWPWYSAAAALTVTLGGCALVAGLVTPRASHCANGILDEDELHADCGGADCPLCAGQACTENDQCQTGDCTGGKCRMPACLPGSDERKDTCEVCHTCENDHACAAHGDCLSGFCADGLCKSCKGDSDCPEGPCDNSRCTLVVCSNQVEDEGETGVDCGGLCAPCAAPCDGGDCVDAGDGGSDAGDGGDPGCMDSAKNGSETDIDCGGACQPCDDALGCANDADCKSGVCDDALHTCAAPTCSDSLQNGDETGVDCGGNKCGNCPGADCVTESDCASGFCAAMSMICSSGTAVWRAATCVRLRAQISASTLILPAPCAKRRCSP